MVGAPFDDMASYFDQLSLSVNWIGGTMENVVRHLGVEQPPHLRYHYPICPRWTEYQDMEATERALVEQTRRMKMIDHLVLFILDLFGLFLFCF